MSEWFDYQNSILMGVFALLLLFEGTRRLALHGISRSTVAMLVGGLLLSVAIGTMAYLRHRMVADAIATLSRPVFAKHVPLPDDWGGKCCKSTLEAESLRLVQAVFVESGQLHTYFDSSGNRIPFIPTEKDIKEREVRVVSNDRLENASQARLSDAVGTLIAAIFSVLFGAGIGYEQRKVAANSKAEPDAQKNDARGSP